MKIHLFFFRYGQVFAFALGHWSGCDHRWNVEVVWKKGEGLAGVVNELPLSSLYVALRWLQFIDFLSVILMPGNPSWSGFGLEMGFGSKNDSVATF